MKRVPSRKRVQPEPLPEETEEIVVDKRKKKKSTPGFSAESRESKIISLAVDLAEKQIRSGTASSQVITHYLKLGTQTAKLEALKLERENELLTAKTEALRSSKRVDEMYEKALKAMRVYGGDRSDDEED